MNKIVTIGYVLAFLPLGILLFSAQFPGWRIWPLRNASASSLIGAWVITILAFGSVFWIGMLDWNSLDWPTTPRLVVGFCLIFIGNGLAFSGMFQIGTKTTSGALGSLHIDGLYKYSRNPQYVGDLMIIIGWLLASASILALPAISFLILAAILAPYIEEPWLSRVYGEAYARYKANTPRFLLGI